MIMTDLQYEITQEWVARFRAALDQVERQADDGDEENRILRRIYADAFRSEIDVLQKQLADYDALRSGQLHALRLDALTDLPRALIAARIAAGLSQRDLADRLDRAEEHVARTEEHEYDDATLGELAAVARALGVTLRGAEVIFPPGAERAA